MLDATPRRLSSRRLQPSDVILPLLMNDRRAEIKNDLEIRDFGQYEDDVKPFGIFKPISLSRIMITKILARSSCHVRTTVRKEQLHPLSRTWLAIFSNYSDRSSFPPGLLPETGKSSSVPSLIISSTCEVAEVG